MAPHGRDDSVSAVAPSRSGPENAMLRNTPEYSSREVLVRSDRALGRDPVGAITSAGPLRLSARGISPAAGEDA